jgi:hypothetical protein
VPPGSIRAAYNFFDPGFSRPPHESVEGENAFEQKRRNQTMKTMILTPIFLALTTAIAIAQPPGPETPEQVRHGVEQLPDDFARTYLDELPTTEHIAKSTRDAAATGRPALGYNITIDGAVFSYPFSRQGVLLITAGVSSPATRNGQNPLELVIQSGTPMTSPSRGALQYVSNTLLGYLFGGSATTTAQMDVAYISYNPDTRTLIVQPDSSSNLSMTTMFLNCFNANSNLTAQVYQVTGGEIRIVFSADMKTFQGTIKVVGSSTFFYGSASYEAKISGTYVKSLTLPY